MQLTVLWRGKPVAGRTVIIRGPKGFKADPRTDKKGTVSFKPEAAGTYLFRTNVDEKASGTFGGKEYQLKRYHSTMSFDLPLEE